MQKIILKSTRTVLDENDEFYEETKETLKKYSQPQKWKKTDDQTMEGGVRSSGCIPAKCYETALSTALREIETLNSFDVPKHLLPKVVEIKGYLQKINEALQNADCIIKKANTWYDVFVKRGYSMAKEEEKKMKMLDIDLQTHIEAAEDSLQDLQNALTSLESDLFWHNGENIVKGVLSTAVFSAVGCAAGYLVGLAVVPAVGAAATFPGYFGTAALSASRLISLRKVAAAGAFLWGAPKLIEQFETIVSKCKEYTGKCNVILGELNGARSTINKKKKMIFKNFPEKMSLLKDNP